MRQDKDQKDIEIIPPDEARRRDQDAPWIHVSFNGPTKSLKDLPLHKRLLLAASWLAGLIVFGFIVFLVIASAVLIWIPLLLAAIVMISALVFFRTKFLRR